VEKIKEIIENDHLLKYVNIVEELIAEDYSVLDIAAALMRFHLYDADAEELDMEAESFEMSKSHPKNRDGNMLRLFITVGKKDKVKPKDIVGAIAGETGVPGHAIGHINIYEEFTFVDVPKEYGKTIISGMKNKKIKGNKINIEKAYAAK
jgi:ATP-dependent RNA helicase DeaD